MVHVLIMTRFASFYMQDSGRYSAGSKFAVAGIDERFVWKKLYWFGYFQNGRAGETE